MVLSYIAYYIVDGKTAGILVFYFLFLHIGMWILITRPPFAPVGMIAQVTVTLILGYELQVRKIGIQEATANGQQYYNVWLLGLTRLATVTAGLFVAWIFTIFPYPITEHSQFRKSLGSALYLLANYYSVSSSLGSTTTCSTDRRCRLYTKPYSFVSPAYRAI
jgi:hypothetical protein